MRLSRSEKKKAQSEDPEAPVEHDDSQLYAFTYEGAEYMTLLTKKFHDRKPYSPPNPKLITAFIPGTIVKVNIREKQKIKKGEPLLALQAMKMNNDILSLIDGTVKKLYVKKGDVVVKNQLLVELK